MVDSERTAHSISPWTMVCAGCGRPVYRAYEGAGRTGRYRDYCVREQRELGYDAAIRRDDFEFAQEQARRAAVLA